MKLEIKGNKVTQEEVEAAVERTLYAKLGRKVTVCHLTLKNGHEVIGMSACVDPEEYDREIGEKIAKGRALNKVWEHMGSILQDRRS